MKYLGSKLILVLAIISGSPILGKDFDIGKGSKEMAEGHGYPCEYFNAITVDGYILGIFRIPGKRGESLAEAKRIPRQPVILQHGFVCSSDDFLSNEVPSLAYMLADAGFDIWLPNLRGNKYSRKHVKLNPNEGSEFWNFTIDEPIKYDLRAIMEFIIKETNYKKISYLGYSMGGGVGFAAASFDPEFYGKYLKSFIGLAPSTRSINSNKMLQLAHYSQVFQVLEFLGLNEIMNFDAISQKLFSDICHNFPTVCELFIGMLSDRQPEHDNDNKYGSFFSHYPAGTSTRQGRHMLQLSTQEYYSEFRHHPNDPLVIYDFNKFPKNVPVAILGGTADMLVGIKDVHWVKGIMEKIGALKFYKEYEGYGHLTFVLPKIIYEPYYDVLTFLKKY